LDVTARRVFLLGSHDISYNVYCGAGGVATSSKHPMTILLLINISMIGSWSGTRTRKVIRPGDFLTLYSFHCQPKLFVVWTFSSPSALPVKGWPSSLYTFPFGLGSGLPSALSVKVSPNLTRFTHGISPKVLKLPISLLCIPIPPFSQNW
jgi:hypothetical protein